MANVVTNVAKSVWSNLVSGLGGTAPKWVGIGSGAGTSAVGDTTLFTEYTTGTWAGYARTANAPTRSTITQTNDTVNYTGTFTAGAAQTVTNAGVFDALTVGNMVIKGDFTGVVLANGDSISVNVTLQFT